MRVRIHLEEARIGKKIKISKDQVRHLKVLKIQKGETIGVFDGKGKEFEAICSEKVSDEIKIDKEIKPRPGLKTSITLAIAVPKGPRMGLLVEKVSELGVTSIVPIICSRGVVKPRKGKIKKWRKIAIEACAQSKRSSVPKVSDPVSFANLLEKVRDYNHAFICHASGESLTKAYCECYSILLIVGPEGDFTEAELEAAKEAGCAKVSLSPTILRTETAGITAVAQTVGLIQKTYK